MYSHRNECPQEFGKYAKIIPQTYFPVLALAQIQAPHAFAQTLIPQNFLPACLGFVPGGCVCVMTRVKKNPAPPSGLRPPNSKVG